MKQLQDQLAAAEARATLAEQRLAATAAKLSSQHEETEHFECQQKLAAAEARAAAAAEAAAAAANAASTDPQSANTDAFVSRKVFEELQAEKLRCEAEAAAKIAELEQRLSVAEASVHKRKVATRWRSKALPHRSSPTQSGQAPLPPADSVAAAVKVRSLTVSIEKLNLVDLSKMSRISHFGVSAHRMARRLALPNGYQKAARRSCARWWPRPSAGL
eukprot:SAG31_NODE_1155_length_9624_cov_3.380157_10_plen_217_part_00